VIDRESIRNGFLLDMVRRAGHPIRLNTDAEMDASQAETMARAPGDVRAGGDAWVFGYGSLMWNPAITYQESRLATLFGYHRDFCLWTPVGRGTPDCPGLVLGLARGGACKGVAYRIKGTDVAEELAVLWRREMISDGYLPRWLTLRTAEGPIPALAFVVNPAADRYAGGLSDDDKARHIARAAGDLGSSRDYLLSTVAHLDDIGVHDRRLHHLKNRLIDWLRQEDGR
jgi:cation transport protein ChaC